MIRELPQAYCPVPIYLVPKEINLEAACAALMGESILGFDTETKPAFQPGQRYSPALMQLAGSSAVYLIQLHAIRKLKPLQDLMEAPGLKVGVGVGEDLRRLIPHFNLKARSKCAQFIDLTTLARSKGFSTGSLRGLTAELLHRRLSKSAQLTNWARPDLTYQQLRYAALDAWASREVFLKLEGK
jgi:ribonuclease D